MSQVWRDFVHQSLKGAVDDPHVRLLRERLRTGSRVVRVHLEDSGRHPEYRILLSLHRQLSETRVPHSESFTQWSLESGTRLASPEEEARRCALLLRERLAPIEQEGGRGFSEALGEILRALRPPQTVERLAGSKPVSPPYPGVADGRALRKLREHIESVLVSLARALVSSFKYTEDEAAEILDAALVRYVAERNAMGVEAVPEL